MQTAHEHPIHREDIPLSVEALELALHDACQRAVLRASSLALALGFYRSVLALAAGLRIARADNGLPLALDADLIASMERVMIMAAEYLRDPTISQPMSIRLHRVVAALGRTVHWARVGTPVRRRGEKPREEPKHREPIHPGGTPAGAAERARIESAHDGDAVPREDPIHREHMAVVRGRVADAMPGMAADRTKADGRSDVTRLIMETAMRGPRGGMPAGLAEKAHAP